MPSFDVISKVNHQELINAISNCNREISTRFDFKGLHIVIEANQKEQSITILAPDDLKLKQVNDLLKGHLIKRKIDPRIFNIQEAVEATGASKRQIIKIKEGISQEAAKKIISEIKKTKIKIQIKIQGNELRVDGKKKDELQEAILLIKDVDIGQPVEFTNFRN
ncbi:MAG: YajQ family cyclic di-GMP-binding protein [Candidatus Pelagibacter sp.]|nr:YajQ family cyclic di-GMP-binding protein [Candidatus Pelagibacter sp.]OUV86973.1 MAG: YajQ family cyclic di-GMP-binding protein [Pelagibacteraceae bacterium TMED136]|tara:strand:- start:1084 stop:1575 length:492 start_codon:yes stop_codon:yes gene_type:complete